LRMNSPHKSRRLFVGRDGAEGRQHLLDDAAVEGVALFHADVEQVERVFEATESAGELLLGGPAGALEGLRPLAGEGLDGATGAVGAGWDRVERRGGPGGGGGGRLDPRERGDAGAERLARLADGLQVVADAPDRLGPALESGEGRRQAIDRLGESIDVR